MPNIRLSRPDDLPALARIFYDGVHQGAASAYTAAQRAAWCPAVPEPTKWAQRLADLTLWVAVDDTDQPVGFMGLAPDGLLDFAYVAPRHKGTGIARQLHTALTDHARSIGLTRLNTEASLIAQPVFAKMGWQIDAHQQIERNGETLQNARMSLVLPPLPRPS